MTKPMDFEVTGIKEVNAQLKKNEIKIRRSISTAMNKISLFMEDEVRQSITGHRNELKSFDTGNFSARLSSRNTLDSATIQDGTGYGKYLEYGTSRLGERRHFRNSLARNKNKITNFLKSEIKKSV